MPFVTTADDVKLNYSDTRGDGRPIVLIHGWPLSGDAFASNIPVLQDAGYRVVTYDRRGFGTSSKPEGATTTTPSPTISRPSSSSSICREPSSSASRWVAARPPGPVADATRASQA